MIKLEVLKDKGIRLERCSEIKDTVNWLEYVEYADYIIPEIHGKVFRKEIDMQTPRKIDSEKGVMVVKIGKCHKSIEGLYGHLLAIFALVRQFQSGTLYCRYCKRPLPEQCQVVALLNFLST